MRIGIIGGGQLGMMMAEAAVPMGHKIVSLDPQEICSITKYSNKHIISPYDSIEGIQELISSIDVLTYEFENVDFSVLQEIKTKLPQKVIALKTSQNRYEEKKLAEKLEIPTPKYKLLSSKEDIFYPSLIKIVSGGYDGKGQFKITKKADINSLSLDDKYSYIIESFIDYDYEISVIASRDRFGKIVYYPIPINIHKKGILFTSSLVDDIPEKIKTLARTYTEKIIIDLDYIGTLAVEYFVVGEKVLFNEFAPRPHNSGHYSIEGTTVSQFRNHILAITGEEVQEPELVKSVIMVNVIGENLGFYLEAKKYECAFVHDYNKAVVKPNRKMGHITVVSDTKEECIKIVRNIIGEKNG